MPTPSCGHILGRSASTRIIFNFHVNFWPAVRPLEPGISGRRNCVRSRPSFRCQSLRTTNSLGWSPTGCQVEAKTTKTAAKEMRAIAPHQNWRAIIERLIFELFLVSRRRAAVSTTPSAVQKGRPTFRQSADCQNVQTVHSDQYIPSHPSRATRRDYQLPPTTITQVRSFE